MKVIIKIEWEWKSFDNGNNKITKNKDDNKKMITKKEKMERGINVRKLLVQVAQTILHLADYFQRFRFPRVEHIHSIGTKIWRVYKSR